MRKLIGGFNRRCLVTCILFFISCIFSSASLAQSFINPSLESWGVVTACDINTPPDYWPNYTNGGLGPDEANFNICPTTIPPNASDSFVYARCYAQDNTAGEGMYQLVSGFVIADSYTISFDYAGSNLYGGVRDVLWHLFIDDIDVDQTPVFHSTDNFWTLHTYTFIATATTHKIGVRCYTSITGTGTGSGGIDNFRLTDISAMPVSSFTSSDTTFCDESGKCISFTDHSTGNPTSWHWLFPGAIPDSSHLQNPDSICYYTPGTYPVTLIVTNSTGTDTLTVSPMITLANPPASPTLAFSNDTIFSSHAAGYQWYYNGSPIAGATDSFYVYSSNGTYAVMISDSNGCSKLSNGLITGLTKMFIGEGALMYPNPAQDEFTIYLSNGQLSTDDGQLSIEIYNVVGEKIYSRQLHTSNLKPQTINCKHFPAGVYFIRFTGEKGSFTKKIVKE